MQENIMSIFENIDIFENQIGSSRSVIEMMHHFYIKQITQRARKTIYTLLWEGDYSRGAIIRGGATIQGNTVCLLKIRPDIDINCPDDKDSIEG